MNNYCAVIIWYNPIKIKFDSLTTFVNLFKHVYIIDNSNNNNSNLLQKYPQISYIPLYGNKGIAKALNTGCNQALTDGFKFCFTFDQDSSFDESNLFKYFNFIEKNSTKFYSFSPCLQLPVIKSKLGLLKSRLLRKTFVQNSNNNELPDYEITDLVISSGNCINLDIWKDLNGFDDKLFIDEVDHDFCIRLNEKYSDSIVRINNVTMLHEIGNPKPSLFHRVDYHHGVRLYYMFRNGLYIADKYPQIEKKYSKKKNLRKIFWQNIRDFYWTDIKYMIKGIKDYKKGIFGPYEK